MGKGEGGKPVEAARLARVFPDHPIHDRELELGFEGFARTLAEVAWNPDNRTPFTVVVRGGWGRGKTTLLRRAQWMLDHPEAAEAPDGVREVRTLWFNAWKYPDDDTVLAGLLGAAIDRLRKGGKLDQLKALVDSYGSSTLKSLFALATPAPLRDLIVEGVEDRHAPVHEKRAFHDTFRRLFNEVSRLFFEFTPAFRDTGGLSEEQLWSPEIQKREVLAVLLDDLDRCRRERVVEVLEAINLFLDLPGVCFFLGIDWERLLAVLPETVRDQGDQFLEKVVQVSFDLPDVSPSGAEEYVAGLLAGTALEAVLGDGEGVSEDVRVLARALESRHPRHVKRFLNDLSMTLAVLRNTEKLGEGEEKLPEAAVVAWHLLSEVLPADRWREVRALPANLMVFLRETERLERIEAAKEGAEKGDEGEVTQEWNRIRASGLPGRHLKTLRELTERQRHILVHLATPPVVKATLPRRRQGKPNLFDIDSPAWVEIPGGSFWMGAQNEDKEAPGYDAEANQDESPVRRVTLGPFLMARHPVTNGEYAAFVQATGQEPPEHWEGGEIPEGKRDHPVVHVSWKDAVGFCEWLSKRQAKGEAERVIRLPTEAEWEYAARGSSGRKYPWLEGTGKMHERLANFRRDMGDTTPVGSYPEGATPDGVHDLAGNVWEWCNDWYGRYPSGDEENPTGPKAGNSRVVRGGSYRFRLEYLRGAHRASYHPTGWGFELGFRVLAVTPRGQ